MFQKLLLFWNSVWSCIVTMEKVLINISDKMCVKPLSKIHDLTDKFTCQYMTQAVYLLTATYYKIAQHDNFTVITIVTDLFQYGK